MLANVIKRHRKLAQVMIAPKKPRELSIQLCLGEIGPSDRVVVVDGSRRRRGEVNRKRNNQTSAPDSSGQEGEKE